MKKFLTEIVVLLVVLGCASGVQAYSYSFDIQSGSLSLTVAQGYASLTLATPDPLVIGYDSYPALDSTMDYDYSVAADMGLAYSVPLLFLSDSISFSDNVALGSFQGVDLNDFITPGGTAVYDDSFLVSGDFEGYTLTDAILNYEFSIIDDGDTLTLNIAEIRLYEGNTDEFLGGLIPYLTNELIGIDPSGLVALTDLSISLTPTPGGTLDLAATPVPVPAAVWLMASGLAGLAGLKRRRTGFPD